MRSLVWSAVLLVLMWVQHALGTRLWLPDLPLAFLAWIALTGRDRDILILCWIAGVLRDAVDPGSLAFHTVTLTAIGLATLAVAERLRTWAWRGWVAWSAGAATFVAAADAYLAPALRSAPLSVLVSIVLTALLSLPTAWLCEGLPAWLRPKPRPMREESRPSRRMAVSEDLG